MNNNISEKNEDNSDSFNLRDVDEYHEDKNMPKVAKKIENNILNLNYNLNITDFEENREKQMIIVRNEKVEIINKSEYKNITVTKLKTPKKRSANLNNLNNSMNIRTKILNDLTQTNSAIAKSDIKENLTARDTYHNINNVISKYNEIKEIVHKISTYTQQIDFTTKSIVSQMNNNFNILSNTINQNLAGIYDNITVSFNNYPRRHIINFIDNSKKIWLFDVRKKNSETKEFDLLKNKLSSSCSIEYDDTDLIFISGGRANPGIFGNESLENISSNMFIILKWSNKAIELNGQMPRKRSNHSTLYFNNKLYVVGGILNESTKIRECECYNVSEKQWELLPSLNSARSSPSLCMYNNRYLYAFRGTGSNGLNLDSIEFLNIENVTNGWSIFKPEDPGMSWLPAAGGSSVVISESKILICGGVNNNYMSYCYFFDPIRKTIFRALDIMKGAVFNTHGTTYENNVILIDWKSESTKQFGIHTYEIENNNWKYY